VLQEFEKGLREVVWALPHVGVPGYRRRVFDGLKALRKPPAIYQRFRRI